MNGKAVPYLLVPQSGHSSPPLKCVYFRFHADPSGTYFQYDAMAIGAGHEGALTALRDAYHKVAHSAWDDVIYEI